MFSVRDTPAEGFPPPLRGRVRERGKARAPASVVPLSPTLPRKGGESPANVLTSHGSFTSSTRETSLAARCRLMRSMGRRGSHRLRIRRRFSEKALITFPFHDPPPDRAMTVANEVCVEHRRAPCTP